MRAWCRYGADSALIFWNPADDARAASELGAIARALEDGVPAGVVEWNTAAHSLLVRGDTDKGLPWDDEAAWAGLLRDLRAVSGGLAGQAPRTHTLAVDYCGPDLAELAARLGVEPGEVAARHAAGEYTVRCVGFAPGFPYLSGLPSELCAPRRATPRTRVPAGSVGIGGPQTGVYTLPTPGGWNIVGYSADRLFSPTGATTADRYRLRVGDSVRFVSKPGSAPEGLPDEPRQPWPEAAGRPAIRVLAAGVAAQLTDAGRFGLRRYGVPSGGAADPQAARWANRLLDNANDAPVLELCFQGQRFEALAAMTVSLTGADLGGVLRRVDTETPVGPGRTITLEPGDVLEFRRATSGVFAYLGVAGGWDGPTWSGSVGGLARAGLGGVVCAGLELAGRRASQAWLPGVAGRRQPWTELRDYRRPPALRVWPGPQWSDFAASERVRFFGREWQVESQSDRSGWRLSGARLSAPPASAWSEPVLPGVIQIPPDGKPIVTMIDGPTVGGYPKIGWIDGESLAWLAQTKPGQWVRFECADDNDPVRTLVDPAGRAL
jgi:biotin-dependent carboxylase-like uncharacterized protein